MESCYQRRHYYIVQQLSIDSLWLRDWKRHSYNLFNVFKADLFSSQPTDHFYKFTLHCSDIRNNKQNPKIPNFYIKIILGTDKASTERERWKKKSSNNSNNSNRAKQQTQNIVITAAHHSQLSICNMSSNQNLLLQEQGRVQNFTYNYDSLHIAD